MALPDVGLVTIEDAETGEQLFVDAGDPGFRERYEALAEPPSRRWPRASHAPASTLLELATDDDLLDALLRFADLRRKRLFGPRMPAPRLADPAHLVRPAP
jgi:hypothetical protein